MKIPFTKMHGLGNNYIYIDGFQVNLEESEIPQLARKISDVNFGIGSDGLIYMLPSEKADVRMRIFNKDGSEGKNCGNGLRCIAKWAYELGYVTETEFQIEANSGVVDAKVFPENGVVEQVSVDMGVPRLKRRDIPMVVDDRDPESRVVNEPFPVANTELNVTAVSMGNPHAVFFVDSIVESPVAELGPIIEKDERFVDGINVEFIEVVSEKELHFRVWERGSGITQACGTGACAAVVASVLNGYSNVGEEVTVHLEGGDLFINMTEEQRVIMRGPAEKVADGIFHWPSV
ncbi:MULTISPECIES: diaminopimelate epimerase [Allobacillus]|uniref:Diaminopimelate epimerase n=1 Tax=Allobacillus salarius TaxID=1955272 RepID=A0A556PBX5_9BACI|nr:diaminopimelate epimerase [Allobacillus salarius]TSJ61885.1 diaminopimelate epimerase [Allobacillus salarius]